MISPLPKCIAIAENNHPLTKDPPALGNFPNSPARPNRKSSPGPPPTKIRDNSTSHSMIPNKPPTTPSNNTQDEPPKQPRSESARSASSATDQ